MVNIPINKEVGVIMSVYNGEKYVSSALGSLFNQNFPKEEYFILAVDDGSTDATMDILNRYKKFNNFLLIRNERNKGLAYSLNKALSLIKSKFVIRFDADDIALPDLLSSLYSNIERYAFCHPYMYVFYGDDLKNRFLYRVSTLPSFFASGVLFRRNVIAKYKYSDIFWEEFDLYLSILEDGAKYKIFRKPLFNHRIHSQNITQDRERFDEGYEVLARKWTKEILEKYDFTLERLYKFYGYYFKNHNENN